MNKEARWLIGIFIAAAVPVIAFQWRQSVDVAETKTSIGSVSESLEKLTETVSELVTHDVTDIKTRVSVLEQKQILPEARRGIDELESRLRELERRLPPD